MSDSTPDSPPDFAAIAQAVLADLHNVPRRAEGGILDEPTREGIVAAAVSQGWRAGHAAGLERAHQPGSLVFTTMPNQHQYALVTRHLVHVDEVPSTGTHHFEPGLLSLGDRALMRTLCETMLRRLEDTEELEADRMATAKEGDR